jgi:hypothetical protein
MRSKQLRVTVLFEDPGLPFAVLPAVIPSTLVDLILFPEWKNVFYLPSS